MYYQNQHSQVRSDNEPGYLYLMQAIGYHGLVPGCYLRRCKIGLSRNPQLRLENFIANQPPCDIKILRTIYVEDMKAVEAKLHNQFQNCKVKLAKSREWFDLTPWQFVLVNWAFSQCDRAVNARDEFTSRTLAAKVLVVSGLALLIATAASGQFQPKQEVLKPAVSQSISLPLSKPTPRQIRKRQSSRVGG